MLSPADRFLFRILAIMAALGGFIALSLFFGWMLT